MLKKRLIGVVTVKNGWAVQSFGYRRYLPLGKPECLVENLDRWGADEILVQVIDRSMNNAGPDFELLDKLAKLGLGTPLIYGGGIRSVEDGVRVVQNGADRVTLDALLHEDPAMVKKLGDQLGVQAIIASLPLSQSQEDEPKWYDYRSHRSINYGKALTELVEQASVSEILITDWLHEGQANGFDSALVDNFPFKGVPLIAFGGISSAHQITQLLARPEIAAVAVGNFLSYQEHALQQFRESVASAALRPAIFSTEHSLLSNV
jgi:cyclase